MKDKATYKSYRVGNRTILVQFINGVADDVTIKKIEQMYNIKIKQVED